MRGEREEKPLTLEARPLWGLGIREEGLHFPVVFWVRVVPGVPGFGAGVILTKRQAAERVTLIEDEKRVLHSGSDGGVWGKRATLLDPLPPSPRRGRRRRPVYVGWRTGVTATLVPWASGSRRA